MEGLIQEIIRLEWNMFQSTQNIGGRASCQDNYSKFCGMRYGQFAAWSNDVRLCYRNDIVSAENQGRNLVAEKYLRMMEFTSPDEYNAQKDLIPQLSERHKKVANEICDELILQTIPLREMYPFLLNAARPLLSSEDTGCITSIQTYQRGELYTYSLETLDALKSHILFLKAGQRSLAHEIMVNTVHYYGYKDLPSAESALQRQYMPKA